MTTTAAAAAAYIPTVASSTSANTTGSTTSSTTQTPAQLKTDFLKLLTTQLQYQDPLSPQSNTDFTSQMAQFSSLDAQNQTNTLLQQLLSAQSGGAMNLAVSYMGKQVVVPGNQTTVQGGVATVGFTMPVAGNATVDIYNPSGQLVNETTLQNMQTGDQKQLINGISGPDGPYNFVVSYVGSDGTRQLATTLSSQKVTGVVNDGSGNIMLDLSGKQVALTDVHRVELAATSGS